MSDASSEPDLLTPLSIPEHPFHARLVSNASSTSASELSSLENSPASSPYYPDFVLYPAVDTDMSVADASGSYFGSAGSTMSSASSPANYSPKPVGLMQPKGNTFTHHGACSQIPKLRVACAAGLNGQRAMWAHCEECGAIEMVSTD
jgi:hypothetical protein